MFVFLGGHPLCPHCGAPPARVLPFFLRKTNEKVQSKRVRGSRRYVCGGALRALDLRVLPVSPLGKRLNTIQRCETIFKSETRFKGAQRDSKV